MKEHNISLDLAAKTSRFNDMLHASNIKMNPENQNGFTLESRIITCITIIYTIFVLILKRNGETFKKTLLNTDTRILLKRIYQYTNILLKINQSTAIIERSDFRYVFENMICELHISLCSLSAVPNSNFTMKYFHQDTPNTFQNSKVTMSTVKGFSKRTTATLVQNTRPLAEGIVHSLRNIPGRGSNVVIFPAPQSASST